MKNKIDTGKLENLSKEEKLKLYDLIQKKKELNKSKRDLFVPHEGQLPVLLSDKKYRIFTAGNGTGKSAVSVNSLIAAAKGYNPWRKVYTKVPSIGVVVIDNPLKQKEVYRKEAAKWINFEEEVEELKNGKPWVNEWVFKNGSRVIFLTHDMEQLIFESIELDYFICDEPPPRDIWIGLARGQRTRGSKPWGLIVGTPISQSWLRTELYESWVKGENPDLEFFRGTTMQNKANLADGYIDSFSRLLTEEEKQIRLEGSFFDLGSLALAHLFKDDMHLVDDFKIPSDWKVVVAIDPHPSKKHVAVVLAINSYNQQKYLIRETAKKMLAKDFAVHLLEITKGLRVVDWVSDSLGSADLTGGDGFKSFIQVLNDYGIRVRATTYEEKLDEEWIERIRNSLAIPIEANNYGQQLPGIQFFKSCVNIVKEIKNVAWIKQKGLDIHKDKLEISNKDYLACLKYALAASVRYTDSRATQARPVKLGSSGNKAVSIRERYFKR